MSDASQIASEIVRILRTSKSPREAAMILAIVRAQLHVDGGGRTEKRVRSMIQEDDKAALAAWSGLTGVMLSS